MNDVDAVKTILRSLVEKIEDLQVNQVVTSALVGKGTSLARVLDAKSLAKPEIEEQYKAIRKQIEDLS